MATEQYNPLAGGRGLGRSRLYAEMGKEKAFEAKRYEEEVTAAEDAAKIDAEGSSIWQGLGSTLAAFTTFLTTKDIQKTAEAWQWGGEAGKWGHRLVSGYDPEDYQISTDMGRFDVQDKYKMADVNRQFEEAHKSRFWRDVAGTGQALGTMALLDGGDSLWEKYINTDMPGKSVMDIAPKNVYRGQPGDYIRFGGGKSTLWETAYS
jgi:hypothetical protein